MTFEFVIGGAGHNVGEDILVWGGVGSISCDVDREPQSFFRGGFYFVNHTIDLPFISLEVVHDIIICHLPWKGAGTASQNCLTGRLGAVVQSARRGGVSTRDSCRRETSHACRALSLRFLYKGSLGFVNRASPFLGQRTSSSGNFFYKIITNCRYFCVRSMLMVFFLFSFSYCSSNANTIFLWRWEL